jgi:hypothetical protein
MLCLPVCRQAGGALWSWLLAYVPMPCLPLSGCLYAGRQYPSGAGCLPAGPCRASPRQLWSRVGLIAEWVALHAALQLVVQAYLTLCVWNCHVVVWLWQVYLPERLGRPNGGLPCSRARWLLGLRVGECLVSR